MSPRERGQIKFFDPQRRFGFVLPDLPSAPDLFFHIQQSEALELPVLTGARVSYCVERGPRGLRAIDVRVVS